MHVHRIPDPDPQRLINEAWSNNENLRYYEREIIPVRYIIKDNEYSGIVLIVAPCNKEWAVLRIQDPVPGTSLNPGSRSGMK
jgi:hypothetical protein